MQKSDKVPNERTRFSHSGYHPHYEHLCDRPHKKPHWVVTHEELKELYREGLWGGILDDVK